MERKFIFLEWAKQHMLSPFATLLFNIFSLRGVENSR
jgi:hypothetical protein